LRILFGHGQAIARDTEITQSHRPVAPASGPPPGPPPRLDADAWPWLAALGVLAVAGLLVWLLAFRGGDGKLVPGVVGLQQQRAIARLTGDGFGVRALVGPSRRRRGIVFAQKPGGGSRLGSGQNVEIHVSNGLGSNGVGAAAPTTTAATTTTGATTTAKAATTVAQAAPVPDVAGQDAAAGAGQVEAAGFVAETAPAAGTGAAGTIVAQEPAAGAAADAGGVVSLSVATGSSRPAEQVPDVVGLQAGAARAAILDARLTVKTGYRHGKPGVVLSQSPAAGASQPAWTQIAIVVGG
jgi:beta-lactam-binding protein with PASTA domain